MHDLVVVPQLTGDTIGEVKAVADMHQRKAEMARHSDCFIALPGPIPLIILFLHSYKYACYLSQSLVDFSQSV